MLLRYSKVLTSSVLETSLCGKTYSFTSVSFQWSSLETAFKNAENYPISTIIHTVYTAYGNTISCAKDTFLHWVMKSKHLFVIPFQTLDKAVENSGHWVSLVSCSLLWQIILYLPPEKLERALTASNHLTILHRGFYGSSNVTVSKAVCLNMNFLMPEEV